MRIPHMGACEVKNQKITAWREYFTPPVTPKCEPKLLHHIHGHPGQIDEIEPPESTISRADQGYLPHP